MAIRYWLQVASHAHVRQSVALGVGENGLGTRSGLAGMRGSDGIAFYSPRVVASGEPLREFTAIGYIADERIFQVEHAGNRPWRRRVDYIENVVTAPIRPLRGMLEFTRDNPDWGYQLRRGLIEISKHDFELIRSQMRPPSPDERIR